MKFCTSTLVMSALVLAISVSGARAVGSTCSDCCNTPNSPGSCNQAFNGQQGMCCGKSKDDVPYCCPPGATCVYNGALSKPTYSCSRVQSPCSLCCKHNDAAHCQKAYNGQPGMCCGSSFSTSYCCPAQNAMCVRSPLTSSFTCKRAGLAASSQANGQTFTNSNNQLYPPHQTYHRRQSSGGSVLSFFFFLMMIGCCCAYCSYRQSQRLIEQQQQQQYGYSAVPLYPGQHQQMVMAPNGAVMPAGYPVVVNGGSSSDGFLNGLMVGELMNAHSRSMMPSYSPYNSYPAAPGFPPPGGYNNNGFYNQQGYNNDFGSEFAADAGHQDHYGGSDDSFSASS